MVAVLTLSLLTGNLPFSGSRPASSGNGGNGGNGAFNPQQTPTPSNVVIVTPVTFKGSIVYAKDGNIWIQTSDAVRQLTNGGHDSMPSWSPDGHWIYFIRTTDAISPWNYGGGTLSYHETIPAVVRVPADGSAPPTKILDGKITKGSRFWFAWIRQPVLAPNGHTLAMVSDGPVPTNSDVVLQFYDLTTRKRTVPGVIETPPLGHQDPVWRSDGKVLLFVRNGRNGNRGAPAIYRWDTAAKTAKPLTGPGYLEPSFSPDGRYIAATRTSALGNDVVILDATSGRELLRVTTDGSSWAPVWSPSGDSIAYLNMQGQIVDLELAKLSGTAPDWAVDQTIDLTQDAGLDGASRPGWFLPASQQPAPSALPSTSGSPSGSATPSASGSSTP